MLQTTTLRKSTGYSLMLLGLTWGVFSIGGDWSKLQFRIQPLSLIAGIGLSVVGYRILRGRVESAASAMGCMWLLIALSGLAIPVAILAHFRIGNWTFTSKWYNGPDDQRGFVISLAVMVAIIAWAIVNLFMLREWVRRSRQ